MKHLSLLVVSMLHLATYANQPTNFIIINLDDVGYGDFSYNEAIGYKTPNIDKMAAEGMRFTHFLARLPISGASRTGLLTGCYPNRIVFSGALGPNSPYEIHKDEVTLAELVKQKGYQTAIYSKWHLGDARQFLPLQNGFDEYYGLPYSNDMWPYHPQQGEIFNFPDLPTVAEISETPLPLHKIEGVSLLPLINGDEEANPRTSFVYYFNKNDLEAVTDETYKLIFPHQHTTYAEDILGNDSQPGDLICRKATGQRQHGLTNEK